MVSFWKLLLTWPYFLHLLYKSRKLTRKWWKNPNEISEAKRYFWVKKKVSYLIWLFNLKIKAYGLKNWPKRKPVLIVSNHQSFVDPLLFIKLNDFSKHAPFAIIGKKELRKDLYAKSFIDLIDVLLVDRQDLRQAFETLKIAQKLIHVPRSLLIFPEGTRTYSSNVLPFHGGSLKIAYNAYVPILPVSIIDSFNLCGRNKISFAFKKRIVRITFHKLLSQNDFISLPSSLVAKQIRKIIQNEIKKRI